MQRVDREGSAGPGELEARGVQGAEPEFKALVVLLPAVVLVQVANEDLRFDPEALQVVAVLVDHALGEHQHAPVRR